MGEHARPHWWWTPVRVLLAMSTIVIALALWRTVPCLSEHWSGNARYSAMCYSDIPYLYTGRGFAEQAWPYVAGRYPGMEYPVVISYAAWALSLVVAVAPQGPPQALRAGVQPEALWGMAGMASEINQYFIATVVVLLAAALLTTWLLAGVTPGRPWAALGFVLSPALMFTALINWDLLALVGVAGALWAWARGRPLVAGLFIGLGTATKLYPLFLLGGVLVICLRERRWRELALAFGGTVLAWLLAQVPAWLGDWERWRLFWSFNADRGADLGSLWLIAQQRGYLVTAHDINVVSWAFFGAVCLAVLALGLRARRTPRLAQLGFLIVAAFLLVNKVYSPQYVLWLLPLAAIARPRWRDLMIWQAGEMIYFGAVWLYLGGWIEGASGDQTAYQLAILIRVAAELYLIVMVVRDVVSGDDDLVDVGGREPAADLDFLAHGGHRD